MKKWKILAISDTHLGEETSLLSFPRGLQHLWETLRKFLGEDDCAQVDEMILLGDIPDRTLSSTSQIVTHTNAFIQTLGSALNIKKGVYIPGNHDHTLWTDLIGRQGRVNKYLVTGTSGEALIKKGALTKWGKKAEALLNLMFGYPYGSSWRGLENKDYEFVVANPVYAATVGDRTYVFTHGTHFRKDVSSPLWFRKFCDAIQLDQALGSIELEPGGDLNQAQSMDDLERFVQPFVDTLWPSSENNPTSHSDQTWYLLTTLSGKFDAKRRIPRKNCLYSLAELNKGKSDLMALTKAGQAKHHSLERWQTFFLPHLKSHLQSNGLNDKDFTFVYGDTHDGGWGELDDDGGKIRIFNTGGWVVHNKDNHPFCNLFAVDEEGQEYILDISYKGVMAGHESLLNLAEKDAEHKYHNTSRIWRTLVNHLA